MNSYLYARLTPDTWEGRRAWLPGIEEGFPRCTGIFSSHSYRIWPMNNWLYNLGQSAFGGLLMLLDTEKRVQQESCKTARRVQLSTWTAKTSRGSAPSTCQRWQLLPKCLSLSLVKTECKRTKLVWQERQG